MRKILTTTGVALALVVPAVAQADDTTPTTAKTTAEKLCRAERGTTDATKAAFAQKYGTNKNKNNDYGFDPHEQEHETYTGMGADINVHDQWACESMGAIQDRTNEHLGTSDKAIGAYRKLLRQAIEQAGKGQKPMMVLDPARAVSFTGPAAIDGIGPADDWQGYWQKTEAVKRKAASWANGH